MDDLLHTATIGKVHGLEGDVRVYPNNPDATNLKKLRKVVLQDKEGSHSEVNIIAQKMVSGQLYMRFEGYETPEKARLLARRLIMVKRSDAAPLAKGEVYVADLIGCKLVYQDKELATVKATLDGPQALLLECEDSDGKSHLVPFMKQYVESYDVVNKTITLAVDWILQ